MPVTGLRSLNHETVPEHSATGTLGQINTTSFLFDDEDAKEATTSPGVKSYLQMNATDDKFPILVRRNDYPGVVSHLPFVVFLGHSSRLVAAFCIFACFRLGTVAVPWFRGDK